MFWGINWNFAPIVGFLNPALNNLAERVTGSTPGGPQNVFFRDACVAEWKQSLWGILLEFFS